MKNFKIKLNKYVFISLLLILFLTGCGDNTSNENASYTTKKESYSDTTNNNNSTNDANTNTSSNIEIPDKEVASFYTNIYDKSENRMNNLRIAAENLSNTVIKSGETFSFNDTMGPSNKKKGYKEAKIFDADGNVIQGYGGGICQISSTLYNVALELNLEIIERHEHSKKVQYVETGKDAAISYDRLDLKFKNTLNYDLTIQCKVEDNKVYISFWGKGQ